MAAWSFFVSFVEFVLLALMFVLEYAARRYFLRGIPHVSIFRSISMYWENRHAAAGKP